MEGSIDSVGRKQHKFTLEYLDDIMEVDCKLLEDVDRLQPGKPETLNFIETERSALQSFCLENEGKLRQLQERLRGKRSELESWIKQTFEVDDLEQQIYLLNAKRRFSEISGGEEPEKQRARLEKPKLRLKLQNTSNAIKEVEEEEGENGEKNSEARNLDNDEEDDDDVYTVNSEEKPKPAGRGAKNLGRMAKPQNDTNPNNQQQQQQQAVDLKPKVPNQVPIATFWNYVEQFFKRIDENDLKYLDDPTRIIDPTPFTIPPLGKHYLEQWRDQYGYHVNSFGGAGIRPLYTNNQVSLKDRLLSMLLELEDAKISLNGDDLSDEIEDTDTSFPSAQTIHTPKQVYSASLEERLKRDLVEAGFLDQSVAKLPIMNEDDQICAELRRLQARLRPLVTINQFRKKRVAKHVRERVLPCQELYSLIDEIDKQLAAVHAKHSKAGSRKRPTASGKKTLTSTDTQSDQNHVRLLKNRERLLEAFLGKIGTRHGYLFPDQTTMFDREAEARLAHQDDDLFI